MGTYDTDLESAVEHPDPELTAFARGDEKMSDLDSVLKSPLDHNNDHDPEDAKTAQPTTAIRSPLPELAPVATAPGVDGGPHANVGDHRHEHAR